MDEYQKLVALLHPHDINVSRETLEKIFLYKDTLLQWNKKINLISSSTEDEIMHRHFLDSLQLVKYIKNRDDNILDFGSGAGFPALVLGAYGYNNITLIDSDSRKCAFLRHISGLLQIKATILNSRIDKIPSQKVDIITARGCAPLQQLLLFADKFMKKNSKCLFLKGKNWQNEIKVIKNKSEYDILAYQSITASTSVVLDIKKRC